MFVDLPLHELRTYRPQRTEPADFDAFWSDTLTEARAAPVSATLEPVDTRMIHVDTFDVTFPGFAGQPVKAWLRIPRGLSGPAPAVVEYIGYGGGRGHEFQPTVWSSLGYVHLVMDSRGQSSPWGGAETPDGDLAPQAGGVLTRGVEHPATYYYRRICTDAVRAVDAVRDLPEVDPARVVVTGGSQGGALALAAAGLSSGLAAACVDVPLLCDVRRATQITDEYPYRELSDYLRYRRDSVERVFATIAYVDGVNFAARASSPALFSTGLMDAVCPPSTVFAAFNHWAHEDRTIEVWEYNAHDGGGAHQVRKQLDFVAAVVGVPAGR